MRHESTSGLSDLSLQLDEPRTTLGLTVPLRRTYTSYHAERRPPADFYSSYYNSNRRSVKGAVASLEAGSKTKISRKQDMLDAADTYPVAQTSSDESSASADEDHEAPTAGPAGDEGVMYSFDANSGPNHGSQILNVALAKAIEKYEDKETVKLVRKEYEMIDDDGESLGLTPVKKGKGKGKDRSANVEDEDYEFV